MIKMGGQRGLVGYRVEIIRDYFPGLGWLQKRLSSWGGARDYELSDTGEVRHVIKRRYPGLADEINRWEGGKKGVFYHRETFNCLGEDPLSITTRIRIYPILENVGAGEQ